VAIDRINALFCNGTKSEDKTMQLNDKEIHQLLINATRYALTRHSYAPSNCCELIRAKWPEIPEQTRNIIARDVDEAIRDDEDLKQYRWPSDIYRGWCSLREFMGVDQLRKLRSIDDAMGDVGAPVYVEGDR
jgi:hypothetical protein